MKKIIIQGKEYNLAYNLRALFVYEELAGKPYKGEKTIECYLFFFAMLSANNEDFSMSFDEFVNACDEDMSLYKTFIEIMREQYKRESAFLENKKKAEMMP